MEFTLKSWPAASTMSCGAARSRTPAGPAGAAARLVHAHADVLHAGQHPDERDLDLVVERPQALRVERGLDRRDQPVDGQRAAGGHGRRRDRRAVEVELALRRRVPVGDAGARVPDDELLEQVAGLGRIDEVGRQRGVERERAHVDVEPGERAHQRLGLVGGQGPSVDPGQRAERIAHRRVAQQGPGDPQHVARGAVGHEREALERGCDPRCPSMPPRPRAARRPSPAAAMAAAALAASSVTLHLGLEHGRLCAGGPQVGVERLGQPIEQRVELEELEEPAHLGDVDGARGRRPARRSRGPGARRARAP